MKRFMTFCFVLLAVLVTTAQADSFGTGGNQFTLDFVPISGSSNPTTAQANDASRGLDGFGIVAYDYRMGKYEVTNDQWNKFVAAYGIPTGAPLYAYDNNFGGHRSYTTDVPTNAVSWYEAAQFVNWLNTSTGRQPAYKFTGTQGTNNYTFSVWASSDSGYNANNPYRNSNAFYFLPTEDEWFKAAYWNGSAIQDYATKPGDTLHQGDGTSGTGWNYEDDGYVFDPYGPWGVGSGSEELNGTYDMMGNNWEWAESPSSDPSYATYSPRGLRGGVWSYNSSVLAASSGSGSNPHGESYDKGFRVASVPEPASILVWFGLGVASLALLRRRR